MVIIIINLKMYFKNNKVKKIVNWDEIDSALVQNFKNKKFFIVDTKELKSIWNFKEEKLNKL